MLLLLEQFLPALCDDAVAFVAFVLGHFEVARHLSVPLLQPGEFRHAVLHTEFEFLLVLFEGIAALLELGVDFAESLQFFLQLVPLSGQLFQAVLLFPQLIAVAFGLQLTALLKGCLHSTDLDGQLFLVGLFQVGLLLDCLPADVFELLESEFQLFDVVPELFAFALEAESIGVPLLDLPKEVLALAMVLFQFLHEFIPLTQVLVFECGCCLEFFLGSSVFGG